MEQTKKKGGRDRAGERERERKGDSDRVRCREKKEK